MRVPEASEISRTGKAGLVAAYPAFAFQGDEQ
jgi:hypothetical protein